MVTGLVQWSLLLGLKPGADTQERGLQADSRRSDSQAGGRFAEHDFNSAPEGDCPVLAAKEGWQLVNRRR
jgi:hypothetical protein